MKYCKFCGKEIEDGHTCSCPEAVQNSQDIKKKIKAAIIAGVAAVVVVLIIIICLACFGNGDKSSSDHSDPSIGENPTDNDNNKGSSSGKIDPFDYMSEPEITGTNEKATFSICLNEDKLARDLTGPEPEDLNEETLSQWLSSYYLYSQYINAIDITYSKETDLKNGDKVTVSITIPDELRNKIKNASKTYAVFDLVDTVDFDFFGNIRIEYTGTSGNAKAEIVKTTNSDVINACIFKISPQYYLSENDEITVAISNADMLEEQYYIVPTEISRTYTVPKLATYAVSASQLPVSVIQGLAEQFYADRLETLQLDKDFEYKNIEYHGTYFYISDGTGSSWNAPYKNILKIDVVYEIYLWGTSHGTRHDSLYFTNILVNADGTISLTYEDYNHSIKSFNEDYYDMTELSFTINTN